MKHFLALPALLRTSSLLGLASQHSFSVQDDLLAFPQYEVRFADEWTSVDEVQFWMARNGNGNSNSNSNRNSNSNHNSNSNSNRNSNSRSSSPQSSEHGPDSATDTQVWRQKPAHGDDGRLPSYDGPDQEYEHERMTLDGQPWLCRIPKAKQESAAGTANETMTQAEEEKELSRAHERGWELLSGMEGNCVYFISGWWSYRFCYKQGIKQFHQLSPSRGVPIYPPVEDPGVPGFMLGTYAKRLDADAAGREQEWEIESALEKSEGAKRRYSKDGELVQRGESRYLVQKLGGGTICDLTGKERKIEVQFHCSPQATDRIAFIKETNTCAYLMVIQTPRLCNDVAFLPPQKDQPNSITCSPVLREDEVEQYEHDLQAVKAAEQENKNWDDTVPPAEAVGGAAYNPHMLPVGDTVVGEHRLVPVGVKIEKSVIVGGGKETYIDTLADSAGRIISKEDMEKLGLSDSKAVEKLKKEVEKIAQGQAWKLDVIDTPRGREYRGIIGDEEEHVKGLGKTGDRSKKAREEGGKKDQAGVGKQDDGSKKRRGKGQKDGSSQDLQGGGSKDSDGRRRTSEQAEDSDSRRRTREQAEKVDESEQEAGERVGSEEEVFRDEL